MFQALLTLTYNDRTETVSLDTETLADIAYRLPNDKELAALFDLLAQHPSLLVRSNIAFKDNLMAETIHQLAKDPSKSVLENLLGSSSGKENLTSEELLAIMKGCPELAASVANNIDGYSALEDTQVIDFLEQHSDPHIRQNLIDNYGTPKRILQRMAINDPDTTVQARARAVLKNR